MRMGTLDARIWVVIWATSLLTTVCHRVAAVDVADDLLMTALLSNYSADSRPPPAPDNEDGEGITVAISFILQSIEGLEWYDMRLSWDPADYGGTKILVIPPTTPVWLPKFALFNNEASDLYTESHYKLTGVRVTHTGLVIWEPGGIITTSCNVDITYYPFDTQRCPVIYVNWLYPSKEVNLTYTSTALDHMLGLYEPNGEWDLIEYDVDRRDNLDPNSDLLYPSVHFYLTLKRRHLYYMMNLIAPCLLLLFLQLFTFYLPPDSNERISFGLTILLSFVVFVIVISESIPPTSDSVPMIEIFLLVCLVTIIVQVILSIYALRIQDMLISYPPDWLLKLCCLRHQLKNRRITAKQKEPVPASISEPIARMISDKQNPDGGLGDASEAQAVSVLREIRALLSAPNSSAENDEDLKGKRDAWQEVILAMDTFCFRFFAVFLALLFIIVLVILPAVPTTT